MNNNTIEFLVNNEDAEKRLDICLSNHISHLTRSSLKKAIEKKFDVKVVKVATINQLGKHKQMTVRSGGRTIRTSGKRSDFKKAIITLDSDSKIDLMRGEVAN